jgi:hypothetical protein
MSEDIFFTDASEAPVPPDEVRIRDLTAKPRRDGARIDVEFSLTPFQRRPNLEVDIHNSEGREVSALSIVEAIDPKMNFTMHLREARTGGHYTLAVRVFYSDIEAHAAPEGTQSSAADILGKARNVVDERTVEFDVAPQGAN